MRKMRKKIKLAVWSALATLTATAIGVGGWFSLREVPASAQLKEGVELQAHYLVGDRFVVPEGTLVVDGVEYVGEALVKAPDGKAYREEEMIFTQAGTYTLQYSCLVNGKRYSDDVDFVVKKETFSMDGQSSTFAYDGVKGEVALSLSPGDVFHYNIPVDLTDMTKNDSLISAYVTSSEKGTRDFSEYYIVMTDCYDSTNQVYIRVKGEKGFDEFKSGSRPEFNYCVAQSYVGVSFSESTLWAGTQNGSTYKTEYFGTPVFTSFSNESDGRTWGSLKPENPEDDWISIRYDAAKQSLYVCDNGGFSGGNGTPQLIADLNNSAVFSGDWQGFTGNKCYISLYAKMINTSANLTIRNIAGLEGEAGVLEDTTPPEIQVNYGEYSEDAIPCGVVDQPYTLFSAAAIDLNIISSIAKCKVYYNYYSTTKELVAITEGKFLPKKAGVYTVVYSAVDAFGNASEELVHITVLDSAETLSLTATDVMAAAGVKTEIVAPELVSCDERLGELSLTVSVRKNTVDEELYSGKLVDFQIKEYIYMLSGEWEIVYTVSDYCREISHVAKATVSADTTVIFDEFEALTIDKYFVSGNSYLLPTVNVVSFTENEAVYTSAKIKAVYGENQSQDIEGNVFTPSVALMGDSVEIVYYDENDEQINISGSRSIYDIGTNGSLDLTKLFLSDKATITADSTNMQIKASERAEIQLINKQYAQSFSMRFNLYTDTENGNEFGQFNVVLTDSKDPDISVKITFERLQTPEMIQVETDKVPHYTAFSVNGGKVSYLEQSFEKLNNLIFGLSYNNTVKKVSIGGKSVDVTTCVNGDAFNGFPSQSVYVSLEMNAVVGEAFVELYTVNAQSFTNYTNDNVRPNIIVDGSYALAYNVGEIIQTHTAIGMDAIGGYSNATITIRELDGEVLSTVDGTPVLGLDASKAYLIKLDKYCEYIVMYNTTDVNGNRASATTFVFAVEDEQKPTLEIVGTPKNIYRQGEKFIMPQVRVSDDKAENMTVFAIIQDQENHYDNVTENGYTFEKVGSYKVVLGVFDEGGNLAKVEYYVEVI